MKTVALVLCLASCVLLPADDAGHWPNYRGPHYNGMASGDAPLRWSDTENVRWKADIPGRGHSSPVIWGDRVFLTTAISSQPTAAQSRRRAQRPLPEHRFEVLCLDRKTGKVIWQHTAVKMQPHEDFHHRYGSFASNAPITDGKRVYAFFGSRGIFCYDLDGKLIWNKNLGPMQSRLEYGEGAAPAIGGDVLLLPFDQETNSYIVALNKDTGVELWRADRKETTNWTMPLVVDLKGQVQAIVGGMSKTIAYETKTGKVIWECAGLGRNVIPAPVRQDDMVYLMSGNRNPNLMAIRLGRTGDLTGTDAVVWQQARGTSYVPSPVLHENKLYVLADNGLLSCYNARTGEPHYQFRRLPQAYSFKSSLVAANGKLYLTAEDEDVVVMKMGEKFEVLATNTLKDQFFVATPAIADGEIFLRGRNTLFCISGK